MDCTQARPLLHDLRRQRLPSPALEAVRAHLATCDGCRRAHEEEAALDDLLRERLPRYEAPPSLRARLSGLEGGRPRPPARRWVRLVAPALAACFAATTGALLLERRSLRDSTDVGGLVAEAVTDHLRVLTSQRPLDIESSGSHDVKPWFQGRLDFAPAVPLPPANDLRLVGGAVGYFLDRKCAVVEYALRRHAVTLLVVPAQGLRWPSGAPFSRASSRGFNAVLWRSGELGYVLVSDANAGDLGTLAESFEAATR